MTLVFLPRYREALKLPPSPRWSLSQVIPRKGQAPGRVTPWIALGHPHAQVDLRCAFRYPPGPLPSPRCLHYQAFGRTTVGLVPFRYTMAATLQTWLVWSRKTTSLAEYKHSACKHLGFRGMQTSLATKPKPRASAYEHGLTNLSTLQSTYANH
jgi:hypothetical protein